VLDSTRGRYCRSTLGGTIVDAKAACAVFFFVRRIHRRSSRKAGKYDAYYGQGQVVQQR
jgi:hypothetical protein